MFVWNLDIFRVYICVDFLDVCFGHKTAALEGPETLQLAVLVQRVSPVVVGWAVMWWGGGIFLVAFGCPFLSHPFSRPLGPSPDQAYWASHPSGLSHSQGPMALAGYVNFKCVVDLAGNVGLNSNISRSRLGYAEIYRTFLEYVYEIFRIHVEYI